MNPAELREFALRLALRAGEHALNTQREAAASCRLKSSRDFVTESDLALERMIVAEILREFPAHKILAEETMNQLAPYDLSTGSLWVIDPIDGTANYALGHSHYAVSIAYIEDGVAQIGVVHAPAQGETFTAMLNCGATLNEQQISVAAVDKLIEATIAFGTGTPRIRDQLAPIAQPQLGACFRRCRDLRRLGAATLDICWVACGRLHAFHELALHSWDIAAARLIASEAGALTGEVWNGLRSSQVPKDLYATDVLIAVPGIYKELQETLKVCEDLPACLQ